MPTRRIILSGLALDARICILEHERLATQPLHIDAEVDEDITRSVDDHDIHSVLDYRRLREAIVEECSQAHVNLIDPLPAPPAARLLRALAAIRSLRLRISKPVAISDCAAVGLEIQITRSHRPHIMQDLGDPPAAAQRPPAQEEYRHEGNKLAKRLAR